MLRVWRFPLVPVEDDEDQLTQGQLTEIEIPEGGEIIHLGFTTKGLTLFAVVDPDAELVKRSFFVCSNGVDLPEGTGAATHRGTFKPGPGTLTAHVFEVVPVVA